MVFIDVHTCQEIQTIESTLSGETYLIMRAEYEKKIFLSDGPVGELITLKYGNTLKELAFNLFVDILALKNSNCKFTPVFGSRDNEPQKY